MTDTELKDISVPLKMECGCDDLHHSRSDLLLSHHINVNITRTCSCNINHLLSIINE